MYYRLDIDLSVERNKVEYPIYGDTITVDFLDGTAELRLDDALSNIINLNRTRYIDVRPEKFFFLYITNTAQAGKWLRMLIGADASFSAEPTYKTGIVNASGIDINPLTDEKLPVLLQRIRYGANSTSTPLGAGGVFTGVSVLISNYKRITGICISDQSGTLYIEQSDNGTNWDYATTFIVTGGTGIAFEVVAVAGYFRVRYVNGGTNQTYFRLGCYLDPR